MSETYICKESFELLTNGQNHNIQEIEIPAPTARQHGVFTRIEAEYNKATAKQQKELMKVLSEALGPEGIKKLQEGDTEKSKEEKDATEEEKMAEVVEFLKVDGVNVSACYSALKDILCDKKSPAKLNDEIKMQTGHFDEIPMAEVKRILGFYIVNFINS